MKEQTIVNEFNYYVGYWFVKLKLNERYKVIVKKDNRIDCCAYVQVKESNIYYIKFNTKHLKKKYKIVHTVLHELGHIVYPLYLKDDEKEYLAEKFALEQVKKHYPHYYKKSIKWTKRSIMDKKIDKCHKIGFTQALKDLGEL